MAINITNINVATFYRSTPVLVELTGTGLANVDRIISVVGQGVHAGTSFLVQFLASLALEAPTNTKVKATLTASWPSSYLQVELPFADLMGDLTVTLSDPQGYGHKTFSPINYREI